MTSDKLVRAIDLALDFLKLNKLCSAMEDDEAFYLTGCKDNGEPYYCPTVCRVEKNTLECSLFLHTDPRWYEPKKPVPFPDERKNVFVESKDF